MITLADARRHLRDRVAEVGTEFWSADDEVMYINLAQEFVAIVTRGVSEEVSGTVNEDTPYLQLPSDVLNSHQLSGFSQTRGVALGTISAADANVVSPYWRRFKGVKPKWFILDLDARRIYVSPIPYRDHDVAVRVSVLPTPVENSEDALYDGQDVMDKYLGVTISLASMYAFLKERYDNDAERAYGFAVRELQSLGANPNEIPSFAQVVASENNSG